MTDPITAEPRIVDSRQVPRGRAGHAWLRAIPRTGAWIPAAAIALLTAPLFLTSRTYGTDWTLHLWLVRQQQLNIEALGHPALVMSTRHLGVFYPLFAFAGSGIYAVGGFLAIVLGDRPILAYKLLYVAGFVLAFGGMTWLSSQLGLRGWRAQVPGLALVTGAYFVTDFVGRGDFGEFLALCSIPFVIAAAHAVFASRSLRPLHVLALTVGVFVFTGSHNITLMLGTGFFVALAIVTGIAFFPRRPAWPRARWYAAATAVAIGVGLNAWYLFADVAWGLDTQASHYDTARLPTTQLARLGLLFNPFRPADTYSPYWRDLRVALPWCFLVWVYVVGRELWNGATRGERRMAAGLGALLVLSLTLAVWQAPWKLLPHATYNVQNTWRLHGYVLLATALLVLCMLRLEARARAPQRRALVALLAAVVAFNLGAAVWQVWRVRSEYVTGHREVVTGRDFAAEVVAARDHEPASWYPGPMYRDLSLPFVATAPERRVTIPVAAARRGRFHGVLAVPDGPAPFRTNLAADSHFVRLTGIRAVGRTADGLIVAVRSAGTAAYGGVTVTIEPAHSRVVTAGAIVSLLSLVAFVLLVGWVVGERRRGPAQSRSMISGA